jgi:hypothetical protein
VWPLLVQMRRAFEHLDRAFYARRRQAKRSRSRDSRLPDTGPEWNRRTGKDGTGAVLLQGKWFDDAAQRLQNGSRDDEGVSGGHR